MEKTCLQHQETLLLEALLSGLDARESAKAAPSPMLLYLSDLLVQRARQELEEVRHALEWIGGSAAEGDAKA